MTRAATPHHQGCRVTARNANRFASVRVGVQIDHDLIVLLGGAALSIVGRRSLELHAFKCNDVVTGADRREMEVATGAHRKWFGHHLRALVALGRVLDQLNLFVGAA